MAGLTNLEEIDALLKPQTMKINLTSIARLLALTWFDHLEKILVSSTPLAIGCVETWVILVSLSYSPHKRIIATNFRFWPKGA